MNTLTIRNFGPIKDVTINLKKVNLLIGTQASGKSTIAKILSILNDFTLPMAKSIERYLIDYNLDFGVNKDTFIEYKTPHTSITVKGKRIEHGLNDKLDEKRVKEFEQSLLGIGVNDENRFDRILIPLLGDTSDNPILHELLRNSEGRSHSSNGMASNEKRKNVIKQFLSQHDCRTHLHNCVYIPAERNIVALIADNFFAFGESLGLPQCIWRFGAKYEKARKSIANNASTRIPFIKDLKFRRTEIKDEILYQGSINSLFQGSSGFQSSIPLALVCLHYQDVMNSFFIIEEPEQNLYPVTQYNLVKFLAESCLKNDNALLMTTHSPYILTSLVNLIQAHNSSSVKPRSTAKIIPKKQWINFEEVSAYFIDEGISRDILDYEYKTIFAEEIDNASSDIAIEYGKLLNLAYPNK